MDDTKDAPPLMAVLMQNGIRFAYDSREIVTRPISLTDDAGNIFTFLKKTGKTVPLKLHKASFLTQTLSRRRTTLWK
jgi:hypothetical protein